MKIATMIAAASLAAFALADEPAAKPAAPEGKKAPAGERAQARPARRPADRMRAPGMAMQDPLVRAVTNPKIAEKIGLTAEQKAKLGDSAELRAKSRELQEKARKATARQMELLRAEPIDEAAVMAAIDETFEARKALAKEQTKRLIVVRSVLTPEQVKMIREEMKAMRAKGDVPRAKKEAKGRKPPKGEPPEGEPPQGEPPQGEPPKGEPKGEPPQGE